jgi:hypothetical protein
MTSFKARLLFAIILYVLALAIRLPGITSPGVQSDEDHWVSRSYRIVTRLHEAPLNATTHMTHPGITPSLAMAAAQVVAHSYNRMRELQPRDLAYVDNVTAARIGNVLFSSLLFPAMTIFLPALLGLMWGVGVALLYLLDPYHLVFSRLAHIDTGLTLMVAATLWLYFRAIEKNSLRHKLLAGVFWGLSIATKPTALALLPAFIAYKAIVRWRAPQAIRESVITAGDVGAFLIGNGVLALLYTRLWHHGSDYLSRLHIHSAIADSIFHTGDVLHVHWVIGLSIFLLLCGATYLLYRRDRQKKKSSPIFLCTSFLTGLTAVLLLVPQVLENLLRFWLWVGGLSHATHVGFKGLASTVPSAGYGKALVSFLPDPILILVFLGLTFTLLRFKKVGTDASVRFEIMALCIVLCWIAFLSVSSKQSWRYVTPVVPLLYVFGAVSLRELCALTSLPKIGAALSPALLALIVCAQAVALYAASPNLETYVNRNFLSYDLRAAIQAGVVRPFTRQGDILSGLRDAIAENRELQLVTVFGDHLALKIAWNRMKVSDPNRVFFGYFPPESADYLITMFGAEDLGDSWNGIKTLPPLREQKIEGYRVSGLWKVPFTQLDTPFQLRITEYARNTGGVRALRKAIDETRKVFALRADQDHAGELYAYPLRLRLLPGTYAFTVNIHPWVGPAAPPTTGAPIDAALTLALLPECRRSYTVAEISTHREIALQCTFTKPTHTLPKIIWGGNTSFFITRAQVSRVP